jgi:CheY-like chemotaxis protein/HPt (histidine-containing phosphotransfer) domain-containing protein
LLFLVVDDDALSRELLTLLLELESYRVASAASGEEAVARLAACAASPNSPPPEVILADLQMPGIAGDALARTLRPLMQQGTLLLAMSGSQPPSQALQGFDGFLLKPFKITELQSMISAGKPLSGGQKDPVPEFSVAEKTGPRAAVTHTHVLDEEIYAKLADLMSGEQLGQMYALCLEDSRKRIAHMKTLAAVGDDAAFRAEAHAVKGGCGMIGATEIYGLAEAAERDGLNMHLNVYSANTAASANALRTSSDSRTAARTIDVTATLHRLSLACDRLERILMARTRE